MRTKTRKASSRERYRKFVAEYKARRLDDQAGETSPLGLADGGTEPHNSQRREYLHDYARWLWPYRYRIAGVLLLALIGAGIELIEPLFARHIIDRVLLDSTLDGSTKLLRLNTLGAAFVVVVILSGLLGAVKDFRQQLLNSRVMLSLRRSLYKRLLHLPLPKLWDMKTGGILSRLTGDVESTTGLLQSAVFSPALSIIKLVASIGLLLAINWRLALVALAVIPGAVIISFVAARRVRPIYRSMRQDVEQVDGRVGETFSGIRIVRSFGHEMRELFDYMASRHTVVRKEMFAHRREVFLWTAWGLLQATVNVVIIWYGGWMNISGGATIGDIMAFQWYTWLLMDPVWNIVNSFSDLQRQLAATERVFEVLDLPDDKPDRPNAKNAPALVREIRFENVQFEYHQNQPVIRDFTVTVKGGSVVALVGRSGAGKTTVTDLVARFHDPTRGRILLNGTDLRDLRLRSYRGLLALVQQDVFLFDGTVRENLAYGGRQVSDREIEDAAKRANAHEFIVKLPQGYDTMIGERGVKLSGGQRQRLAIARAMLASPQILILDEATSSLDTESEQLIQSAMASLVVGRTTFIIAHRLSTVRHADLILLLDEGRIIERGTHEELMEARGVYHDMVLRQAHAHGLIDEPIVEWDTPQRAALA